MKNILKYSAIIALTIAANFIFFAIFPHKGCDFSFFFFNFLLQVCLIGLIAKPTPKEI